MKIAITGGHITPAIAIIDELKRRDSKVKIIYFGRRYSFEGDKVLSNDLKIISRIKGVQYVNLETGRLQREFTKHTIASLFKIPRGFIQAYKELKKEKPKLILSFGGYLALPVVITGFILRIPIITHEQTVTVGLSNRIVSLFARKILVSWERSKQYFSEKKTVAVGIPVRKEIYKMDKNSLSTLPTPLRKILKEKLDKPQLKLIYVTGGNQGSQTINKAIWEILTELLKNYYIIHQCGHKDWEAIQRGKIKLPLTNKRYHLSPWLDSLEVGWVIRSADLIISRAGANTVYELGILGKPSLFIPIPYVVNNEQQKNAEILSDAGLARILSQNNLKPWKLKSTVDEMFVNIDEYRQKGIDFRSQMRLDAASQIVEQILKFVS